jgi:hypothetical protein
VEALLSGALSLLFKLEAFAIGGGQHVFKLVLLLVYTGVLLADYFSLRLDHYYVSLRKTLGFAHWRLMRCRESKHVFVPAAVRNANLSSLTRVAFLCVLRQILGGGFSKCNALVLLD